MGLRPRGPPSLSLRLSESGRKTDITAQLHGDFGKKHGHRYAGPAHKRSSPATQESWIQPSRTICMSQLVENDKPVISSTTTHISPAINPKISLFCAGGRETGVTAPHIHHCLTTRRPNRSMPPLSRRFPFARPISMPPASVNQADTISGLSMRLDVDWLNRRESNLAHLRQPTTAVSDSECGFRAGISGGGSQGMWQAQKVRTS